MTEQHYYYGTGKRKTSVAQVRLYPGRGEFSINNKSLEDAFPLEAWQSTILEPMKVTESQGKFNTVVKLHGGGVSSQAGALRHGIARALLLFDISLRLPYQGLKDQGEQEVRPQAGQESSPVHQAIALFGRHLP